MPTETIARDATAARTGLAGRSRLFPGALVITGGGRGIGAEIARAAASAGTPVGLIYKSRTDATAGVAAEIAAAGGRAITIAADIGEDSEVRRAFDAIDRALGPIGGLVNNAGIPGPPARFADLAPGDLERVFHTNVFGAFFCSREAVRRLSTRTGGSGGPIVSLSSAVAVGTGGPGAWVHYAASKSALETMSRGLAKEVAVEGIRVNIVRVGVVATETRMNQPEEHRNRALSQVPMSRMGQPSEVAAAVLWLLSPESSYVTGAVLDVAGGF
jgi:NAD(P)-dependent dehydrogenase (short-subunit alcohol dehydrogenase family)